MKCTIVKDGVECGFMTKQGCSFGAPSETCHPVIDKCEGCAYVEEYPGGKYCAKFAAPEMKWLLGICNMATHVKIEEKVEKKKINPLKASKRAAGR